MWRDVWVNKKKISLIFKGKGNTYTAIDAFIKGMGDKNEIEIIEPDKLNISTCKGCGVCQCYKGCIAKDDTNPTIDKIVAADLIVFATPVYWWGVTVQLKLIIDKCYCKGALLKGKQVGVIVIGGSPTDNEQYSLIKRQFECMADYLDWNMRFFKAYYKTGKDELSHDEAAIRELMALGEQC